MATARKHITYEDFIANAGAIFDEVAAGGTHLLVEHGGQVFEIVPRAKRRSRKSGILGPRDSMRDIIGMAETSGPTDVSENKHRYLADAYAGDQQ